MLTETWTNIIILVGLSRVHKFQKCTKLWRMFCAGFRYSADFHARVVLLHSGTFRQVLLVEVDDALGVLGVGRVVAIVVSVLVRGR